MKFCEGETMSLNDLTNEKLVKPYRNSFDLVNHAIDLARDIISSGDHERLEGKVSQASELLTILMNQDNEKSNKDSNKQKEIDNP